MKYFLTLLLLSTLLLACQPDVKQSGLLVTDATELETAIQQAQPGDEIILANGSWENVSIRFTGKGTAAKPITLRAETPGEVIIEGESDLKFGGDYLVVSGLHFKNGYSPSRSVIAFNIKDTMANHCRITQCVIEDFNKLKRDDTDLWVLFRGRYNQLDHCYLAGKANRGPTVRIDLEGNESIKNYHQINNNHFGPRPPKGGPSAETIQLGNSYTSMAPSYAQVTDNFFERCNGEVEVISSKSNFNEFRNNVFYKSEGSLVTRHGNYCTVDGNYFIGDPQSENIGGIRIIGTGHWVTNNYFYDLKGQNFRSPLAVMNGIPKSPQNRYVQVTDVVVAYNSWINCASPLQFGVGSNISQKDVLPASEIRSARPIRTTVANNLIFNEKGDPSPVVAHDKIDDINFQNNIINNQGVKFDPIKGLKSHAVEMTAISENLWVPSGDLSSLPLFTGFEFETIDKDIFGHDRTKQNAPGAVSKTPNPVPNILDKSKFGASWYSTETDKGASGTHAVSTNPGDLAAKMAAAKEGDILELAAGTHEVKNPVTINKRITIQSKDKNSRAIISYTGPAQTPAFTMHPKGKLVLKQIELTGQGTQHAFASLQENMSSLYNLKVSNCTVSNFDHILKAYKQSFSEYITFINTTFSNCENGIVLAEETEDKGSYNVENLTVDSCRFEAIQNDVINYYRGGYDESTVGGTLVVTNSTFTNCGAKDKDGILLNTYGIINVDISNNRFKNNPVKVVALLWGAKNNTHSNNEIINSGQIVVEENLQLKLLY